MISLKYQENTEIENKFYEYVTNKRNKNCIADIDKKCQMYLNKTFKEVVCASPKALKELHVSLIQKTNYEQIKEKFKCIGGDKFKRKGNYIVKTLYHGLPKEAKQLIYNQLKLKTCPYCNRNFIEKLELDTSEGNRKYVGTFELDHFYSKDKFPMFAVSFYNLIPVCSVCNSIKGDDDFYLNPYLLDQKDHVSFTYDILGSEYMDNEEQLRIKINSSSQEALKDAENLHLMEIYNGHKDIVCEIIKKTRYYNPEYVESLLNATGTLFKDKDELYRLLYGGYANSDEYEKRPLSKFIKDIYQDTIRTMGEFDVLET